MAGGSAPTESPLTTFDIRGDRRRTRRTRIDGRNKGKMTVTDKGILIGGRQPGTSTGISTGISFDNAPWVAVLFRRRIWDAVSVVPRRRRSAPVSLCKSS